MKVGLVSPYSLTVPGGVQNQVLGLARALRRQGVDTRVLGPCDGPPPDVGVTALGNSIPTAANGSVAPVAPDPPAQLRMVWALRSERFDVLHLHEPFAPGPNYMALLTKPAPIIGTFHAAGRSSSYRYLPGLVRYLAGRLDHRCAVSEQARSLVAEVIDGEIEVVFNGVEIGGHETTTQPTQGPTIFFLGRHEPRKGLAVLLGAMAHLPPEVRLWIGGDGPETDELRRAAAGDPRIEWLGRVSGAEKLRRLRSCDVFCAPSLRGESFGVVLLEAMAADTAVVASRIDGYAAVARDGVDALLVPPGDEQLLAETIRRVLFEPGVRTGMVRSGRERVEEYSMDRLAARYRALYSHYARSRR